MRYLFIILLSIGLLAGCSKKKSEQAPATQPSEKTSEQSQPAQEGKMDVNTNKPHQIPESDFVTTPSGLKYADLVVGSGEQPKTGDVVVVHYTGWLTDGTRFDSSVLRGQPFKFPLGMHRVIPGWDEGLSTMKVGGVRQLVIPPQLAYGDRGAGGVIPPNATLIFEVKLLGIEKQ